MGENPDVCGDFRVQNTWDPAASPLIIMELN